MFCRNPTFAADQTPRINTASPSTTRTIADPLFTMNSVFAVLVTVAVGLLVLCHAEEVPDSPTEVLVPPPKRTGIVYLIHVLGVPKDAKDVIFDDNVVSDKDANDKEGVLLVEAFPADGPLPDGIYINPTKEEDIPKEKRSVKDELKEGSLIGAGNPRKKRTICLKCVSGGGGGGGYPGGGGGGGYPGGGHGGGGYPGGGGGGHHGGGGGGGHGGGGGGYPGGGGGGFYPGGGGGHGGGGGGYPGGGGGHGGGGGIYPGGGGGGGGGKPCNTCGGGGGGSGSFSQSSSSSSSGSWGYGRK